MDGEAATKGGKGYVLNVDGVKRNDGIMHLQIVEIEMVGTGQRKHNTYRIKGKDNLGEIDVTRRYNQFNIFRETLFRRYPGLFIPPLPPKQFQQNKDASFGVERK